jgi:hypothetical protein
VNHHSLNLAVYYCALPSSGSSFYDTLQTGTRNLHHTVTHKLERANTTSVANYIFYAKFNEMSDYFHTE